MLHFNPQAPELEASRLAEIRATTTYNEQMRKKQQISSLLKDAVTAHTSREDAIKDLRYNYSFFCTETPHFGHSERKCDKSTSFSLGCFFFFFLTKKVWFRGIVSKTQLKLRERAPLITNASFITNSFVFVMNDDSETL